MTNKMAPTPQSTNLPSAHAASHVAHQASHPAAIEELARSALRCSTYPSVRLVRCHFRNGALVLQGSVPSYFLMQVAQSLVLSRLNASATIDNQLLVEPAPQP